MLRASVALFLAVTSVNMVQSAVVNQQRTCFDFQRDRYQYYSTRTAYRSVHGNLSRLHASCKPLQIWMLCRHGTRYPEWTATKNLLNLPAMRDQILKNHENGSGNLCNKNLQRLKVWRLNPNFKENTSQFLAPQGRNDLYFLAKRLQYAFPELLQNAEPDNFIFQSTNTQRTKESLNSFTNGLFGNKTVTTIVNPVSNDTLLLPFNICPAWKKSITTDHVDVERFKFMAGPEIQGVLMNVSRRLGYDQPLNLTTIKTLYEICRFEEALNMNLASVWCSIFTKEELKILEYGEDLGKYHYYGPGRKLSAKMSCSLLSDMFKHFKSLATGSTNEPKGIFYFAHTVTLGSFLSALKIAHEDVPLLASTYATSANRKFRTSILGPFATNVVAVFYRCNDGSNKVTFHIAERLTPIVSCKEDGTCDWEVLEQTFKDQISNCDLKFCFEN